MRLCIEKSLWKLAILRDSLVFHGNMVIDKKTDEVLGPAVDYTHYKEKFKLMLFLQTIRSHAVGWGRFML